MNLVFANPLGAWGLTAVLGLVLVYMLRRVNQTRFTPGLFLLPLQGETQRPGLRVRRFRARSSFFLQLLVILLLAGALSQPLWMDRNSRQRVAVVLDASISMDAFHREVESALRERLTEIDRWTARTDWVLLESHQGRNVLYSGNERAGLLRQLEGWQPAAGTHDPEPVLLSLRTGGVNHTIFVSDRVRDVPPGVELIAIGRPLQNVGFSGMRLDEGATDRTWRAVVRNYSNEKVEREWWLEDEAGGRSSGQRLVLDPGELRTLRGPFPKGASRLTLRLTPDDFHADDVLPILSSSIPPLRVWLDQDPGMQELATRLFRSHSDLRPAADPNDADLFIGSGDHPGPAVLFPTEVKSTKFRKAPVIAEMHRYTEGLRWQGLLAPHAPGMLRGTPLVWRGDRAVIAVEEERLQLHFGVPLAESNVARLPAFAVLLHRFFQDVRLRTPLRQGEIARRNLELNELFSLAGIPAGQQVLVQTAGGQSRSWGGSGGILFLRGPGRPGFFQVKLGERVLVEGAAHFADVREADFSEAASGSNRVSAEREAELVSASGTELYPLWLFAAAVFALWCWASERGVRRVV